MWSSTALLLLIEILFCILAVILTFRSPAPGPCLRGNQIFVVSAGFPQLFLTSPSLTVSTGTRRSKLETYKSHNAEGGRTEKTIQTNTWTGSFKISKLESRHTNEEVRAVR